MPPVCPKLTCTGVRVGEAVARGWLGEATRLVEGVGTTTLGGMKKVCPPVGEAALAEQAVNASATNARLPTAAAIECGPRWATRWENLIEPAIFPLPSSVIVIEEPGRTLAEACDPGLAPRVRSS
jgi:hypothetical protein